MGKFRTRLLLVLIVWPLASMVCGGTSRREMLDFPKFKISWKKAKADSWEYTVKNGESLTVRFPVVEMDGNETAVVLTYVKAVGSPVTLRSGAKEYVYEGPLENNPQLVMQLRFRVAHDNAVVRFNYSLRGSNARLSKKSGKDRITYLTTSLQAFDEVREIRLTVFNEMIHSCHLSEVNLSSGDFDNSGSVTGPILIAQNQKNAFLLAYEHDSMYPNPFLTFGLRENRNVELSAVRGNYYRGQSVDGFSTVWMEIAGVPGDDKLLAAEYRKFAGSYLSQNLESRKPYIYYNTWGRQERDKWAGGQYLTNMNLAYTLREMDRAHEMGIEFYVLDAGWFDKTGDWGIHPTNFPDGFRQVKEKAEDFGMKLGVWMDPKKAAMSSRALARNENFRKTINGKPGSPSPVWETEASVDMCLVSPYHDYYVQELIRLYQELGIRYFYLDGVSQQGCNDAGHFHGTAANSLEERNDSYAFQMPVYLNKIIEKVSAACPDVIFDFDVTESGRIGAGLQFLTVGRYFILNNGPYYHNFDLVSKGNSLLPNGNRNIFVQPGPARTWFMRSVLDYDQWLPSNLFLANYQTDDPESSQLINLASLVLGQNSIWGDILKTSKEGTDLIAAVIEKYKEVRNDVVAASPIRVGRPGDTPEIYEKINPDTGRGVVVIFANGKGTFSYTTAHRVSPDYWASQGVKVKSGKNQHASLEASFEEPSARIIFFGADGAESN